jgi:FMN phosphatase YigB (HAD superfamily)
MPETSSIRELFHNFIVLRDLEPYRSEIRGLSALRKELGVPGDVTPRKNEVDYARVIERMVEGLSRGTAKNLLFVGDTPFTDGSVVRNLSHTGTYRTLGLICRESTREWAPDLVIRDLILCSHWSRITKIILEATRRGFGFDDSTVALFDLDNTVYSARGRCDRPLREARVSAVKEIVRAIMGVGRFEDAPIDRVYREFDNEQYHPLTSDNQDYVLVLSLCCLLGVSSIEEIRREFLMTGSLMLNFIERCRDRLQKRKTAEPLAWEFIQEVYFNARQNDPTPCKTFRQNEYLQTLRRMKDRSLPAAEQIVLTREVVELISYLRGQGITVIAFSDKPKESAEDILLNQGGESIFDIDLPVVGQSISAELRGMS